MPIRIVQSKQNARLKELRRALASPGRNESGLAGIEGAKPAGRGGARGAAHRVRVCGAGIGTAAGDARTCRPEMEVLAMPRELLDAALTTETPQPVAALVEPPDWTWAHFLGDRKGSAPLVVVLAGLQDPGNLGTILAFG